MKNATTVCPCGATRRYRQYLCGGCWDQLPGWVQTALKKRDVRAARRGAQLFQQIRDGRALAEIEVTP